jgi:MFS transporter, FSR family, fosmidomycin resistance protein
VILTKEGTNVIKETSDDLLSGRSPKAPWRSLGVLTGAHFATDFYQGAIPALLPFLVLALGLSLARTSLLVLAYTVTAAVMQPVFGWLADRVTLSWLTPSGVLISGLTFSLLGFTESLSALVLLAACCGLGSAAFHPPAAKVVTSLLTEHPSLGLSIFMVGGQAGFAAGPVVLGLLLTIFDLRGAALLAIPAVVATTALLIERRSIGATRTSVYAQTVESGGRKDEWGPFCMLLTVVLCWSIVSIGVYSFLALFWTNELGRAASSGNSALTVTLVSGIAGMVLGSWLADRVGGPTVMLGAFVCAVPSTLLLLAVDDPSIALILVIPLGASVYSPFAVMIVLGQAYLPSYAGLASGLTMGLSLSIGGLAAPLLGLIGDNYGLHWVFASLAGVSVLASILSLILVGMVRSGRT